MTRLMSGRPQRLLFVCTGNICRSPMAEALFLALCRERSLTDRFEVDSAGLGDWHTGDRADPRTRKVGERHGVPVASIARQVQPSDFERFDLILAMDRGHLSELKAFCPREQRPKLKLMRDWDPEHRGADVDDPYYGGLESFERMFDVLSICCRNLLDDLVREAGSGAVSPLGPLAETS